MARAVHLESSWRQAICNGSFDTGSEDGSEYTWNMAGKLIQSEVWPDTAGHNTVQYTYTHNGAGRLLDRTVNGVTTRFHWSGYRPYLLEEDSTEKYAYFGSDIRFDLGNGTLESTDSAHFYLHDEAGNVIAVAGEDGTLETNFAYDAWGNDLSGNFTSNPENIRRFRTSKYYDEITGLYFNHARWYDPALGRFISESPIAPMSEEDYVYCHNAPTNFADVNGEIGFAVFKILIKLYNIKMTLEEIKDLWDLLNNDCASLSDKIWGISLFGLDYLIPIDWLKKFPGLNKLDDCIRLHNGQLHHGIPKKVYDALEEHPNLRGKYKYRDPRFETKAKDLDSHKGYQGWHRDLDDEVAKWIREHPDANEEMFQNYLKELYNRPDIKTRFPNGFE